MEDAKAIVARLEEVLVHLHANQYPYIPNPEGCKRRASVAVILRVRPAYKPVAIANGSIVELEEPDSIPTSLQEFFSQEWVKGGDPEVLFIKRAGRSGDRWSGHVALPGGKRDPEDEDDVSAAIRETREEVGLELTGSNCLHAGNLPQRVVAARGRGPPLMVLCPYIFLLTDKHVQTPLPQPTEVAGAHWVPLRALLSENLRTGEYVDTVSRMTKRAGWFVQQLVLAIVGKMVVSAIRLAPSESVYASSIPGFIPKDGGSRFAGLSKGPLGIPSSTEGDLTHEQPLLLWGLTLGVLTDLLDMLPPYNAVKLWIYPTFTPIDLRFMIWILTRGLRQNNAGELSAGTWPSNTSSTTTYTTTAVTSAEAEPTKALQEKREVGVIHLGVGSNPKHVAGTLLADYYDRIHLGVGFFVAYRTIVGSTTMYWLYKLWRRRQTA